MRVGTPPVEAAEVDEGAEALQRRGGRIQLEPPRVLVAQDRARLGQKDARPRAVVGRVQFVPPADRLAQWGDRTGRLACGELDRAPRVG
ncbi:MAG: hypothetical protein M3O70_15575, partial [Actinomycetota bacterium]|nr:hypothetical protein [Actinomycetota bacterium]